MSAYLHKIALIGLFVVSFGPGTLWADSTNYYLPIGKAEFRFFCEGILRSGRMGKCSLWALKNGEWKLVSEDHFAYAPLVKNAKSIAGESRKSYEWDSGVKLLPNTGNGAVFVDSKQAYLCTPEGRVFPFNRDLIDPITNSIHIHRVAGSTPFYQIETRFAYPPKGKGSLFRGPRQTEPDLRISNFQIASDGSIPKAEIHPIASENEIKKIRDFIPPYNFEMKKLSNPEEVIRYRLRFLNLSDNDAVLERQDAGGKWEQILRDNFLHVTTDLRDLGRVGPRYPSERKPPSADIPRGSDARFFLGQKRAYILTPEGKLLSFDSKLLDLRPGTLIKTERSLNGSNDAVTYTIRSELISGRDWDPFKLSEVEISAENGLLSSFRHRGPIPKPTPNPLAGLFENFESRADYGGAKSRYSESKDLQAEASGSPSRSQAQPQARAKPTSSEEKSTTTYIGSDLALSKGGFDLRIDPNGRLTVFFKGTPFHDFKFDSPPVGIAVSLSSKSRAAVATRDGEIHIIDLREGTFVSKIPAIPGPDGEIQIPNLKYEGASFIAEYQASKIYRVYSRSTYEYAFTRNIKSSNLAKCIKANLSERPSQNGSF